MNNKGSIRGRVIIKVLSLLMNNPRKAVKTGFHYSRKKYYWHVPKNFQLKKLSLDSLPIEILFSNKNINSDKIIIQFHGGAFLFRYNNIYRKVAYKYATISNAKVVSIDYHTVPYHPFPQVLDDAIKVWTYVINEGYKPENIIIVGDSAGGNIALSLTIYLRDNNMALPNSLILLSPWADLTLKGKSYQYNLYNDPLFGIKKKEKQSIITIMHNLIKAYANNYELTNKYLSPVYDDFHSFPNILLIVGTLEMLESDAITIYDKAKAANVNVQLLKYLGMFHVFPLLFNLIPESKHAWNKINSFINSHLNSSDQ